MHYVLASGLSQAYIRYCECRKHSVSRRAFRPRMIGVEQMKTNNVTTSRNYKVRAASVLNKTNLAGKVSATPGKGSYDTFESAEELRTLVSDADLLAMVNAAAREKALSEAKTQSPWTNIETLVAAVMGVKNVEAQDALDALLLAGLITIPTFVDVEEVDETETESASAAR